MKDKKGFTLVELLAVVVIMGIIIGISIPAVTAVQKRLVKQRVTTFYKIVDEAADAYVEQYHTDFEKTRDCFEISYKDLIDQELLKETDITCLSEAYTGVDGKVIATRVNGGETFTYTHYLTCYDKETNKPLSKSEELPEGCIGIRGGFSLEVKAIHVKRGGGEEPYTCTNPINNECWVSGSIRYEFSSTSPYYHDIKEFQYRELGNIKWESIPSTGEGTGSKVFSTENNTNYEQSSISKDIKYRAIDTGNNISSEDGVHYIRIDNTIPKSNIVNAAEGWQNTSMTISFTTNVVPSGIKKYYLDLNNDNTADKEIEGTVASYTFEGDFTGTIKVRAESNTGILGPWSDTKTIMQDTTPPGCTSSGGSNSWSRTSITLTGTCNDTGSGCAGDVTKTYSTNTNSTTESPGIVKDIAGNETTCPANQTVKVDVSSPTCTINKTVTGSTAGVNLTVVCNDSGSSGCSNQTKTGVKSTTTYTVTDGAGNTGSCTATITPVYTGFGTYYDTTAPTYSGTIYCYRCREGGTIQQYSDGYFCYKARPNLYSGRCYCLTSYDNGGGLYETIPVNSYSDSSCSHYCANVLSTSGYGNLSRDPCTGGFSEYGSSACRMAVASSNVTCNTQARYNNPSAQCPSGYSNYGNTCNRTCPSGWSYSNGSCRLGHSCNTSTCSTSGCSCAYVYN